MKAAQETKHTPGPWRIVDRGQQMTQQISGPGVLCPIARLVDIGQGKSLEMGANARLIAAAPILLAAARAVLEAENILASARARMVPEKMEIRLVSEKEKALDVLQAAIAAVEKGGAA